ncbi:CaiB/BaiF CoA-transferase family protein [Blastococcus sp. CT_GayMR20]|uniref:CaiB/BaiF CoA transferase family protein n=1 Tax=Blastococcus sp. CT_GayMR20 TaxID=2559609 RepID=UPI00143192A4|nr:CaiB/BaiF CoA-transferase family protein [Blastococcus sp. CT_GayMR20]
MAASGDAPTGQQLPGPLGGITVVEFGRFVTAPYAARLLSDLGAGVIKLETEHGDPFRSFGADPKLSAQFLALNRTKRSVRLNPRTKAGKAAVLALLDSADVFIENSRPGSMARMGLDYETLKARNPGLIYCSITGAGTEGPYAARPAYDAVGQALSGLASQFIDPEDPHVAGPNLSDSLTGMTAAYGILGALVHRSASGRGQLVEVDMITSGLALLGAEAQVYFETGVVPGPYTRPGNSSSFVIRCSDGKLVAIHLSSVEKFWLGLSRGLERPDLVTDPRFEARAGRIENYEQLRQELVETMAKRSSTEWLSRFTAEDVPCAPVHDLADVFEDKDLAALRLRRRLTGPERAMSTVAIPVRFDTTPVSDGYLPPELGEHTHAVLRELGFDEQRLADVLEADQPGQQATGAPGPGSTDKTETGTASHAPAHSSTTGEDR